MRSLIFLRCFSLFCGTAALFSSLNAGDVTPPGLALDAPVALENLDSDTYAEWVDGQERKIHGDGPAFSPQWILWTDKSQPGHSMVEFGKSDRAGRRHLRIGFVSPLAVGTVLVWGGGQLSVLKPGASYPGDLGDDSQWISAQRLEDGKVTTAGVGLDQYAVWVLPPGTTTQALRFTHESVDSDSNYEGRLGGVFIATGRYENLAPYATTSALSNSHASRKVNDGTVNCWGSWENREKSPEGTSSAPAITPERPEWILLSWAKPVTVSALVALFPGFGSADIQILGASATGHPRDAAESEWQTLAGFTGVEIGYPIRLWPNWLAFPKEVTTRAVRLRMTSVYDKPVHEHVQGLMMDGRRVWLDELLVLSPLGDRPLESVVTASPENLKPPIPVKFQLQEPGFVTLVIEKPDGQRVRNLISETHFPAGENVVWWDGTDDLGRDPDAAAHGVYHIPSRLVAPGEYRVRGLTRREIVPHYEFPVYNAGNPAWSTPDKTGAWLSNHTPPQAAVFVPADRNPSGKPVVYLGSYISEGRDGLAWVDLQGRKLGGRHWVGGNWTGAPFIAFDAGPDAAKETIIYVGSVWSTAADPERAELRLTAVEKSGDKPILKMEFDPQDHKKITEEIAGMAAHNGILVVSLPHRKELLVVDAKQGKAIGSIPMDDPRGLAFDAQGRLYAVAGTRVLRFAAVKDPANLPAPETLIADGLEDPQQITLGPAGDLLVSDWGNSHQVKVFSPVPGSADRYTSAGGIGHPGAPGAGPHDPLHLNHPYGMTVDSDNRLWVAEKDFLPKRVSVWTPDGQLAHAFYGPSKYGGGGGLDSKDKNRFYYAEGDQGSMEFRLDWEKGTSELTSVFYRPGPNDLKLPLSMSVASSAPEVALYRDGKRYFTNCFNSNPVSGESVGTLFLERDGIARPVAAMGRANDWALLKEPQFVSLWPEGVDLDSKNYWQNLAYFSWCDTNDDALVQPNEVVMQKGKTGGVTVMPDLSFCFAVQEGKTVRYSPAGFSKTGIPKYDLANPQILAEGVIDPASSGGSQALTGADGWTVVTLGIAPFAQQSLSGAKNGVPMWSYPSVWPGLHAAHEAPTPIQPGMLIGTTRLLGGFFEPKGSKAGPLWAVNGNLGTVYVFTADGLFVATLFADSRLGKPWAMPAATRGMSLDGVTLHEENFWPTINQTSDGNVYIMDGSRSSIVSLPGLETVRRLPDTSLKVTADDLAKATEYEVQAEIQRQQEQGKGVLEVAMLRKKPVVDGGLEDWKSAWVDIDKRGVKANFNSNSKPYDVSGSVAVAGDRLFAAYRTGNPKLLENSGETPMALFKTGGALDLMIGANPAADPERKNPVAGDIRLLVTLVDGKPRALLYRAVVPNTPNSSKVPFSSPWRTITFDQVKDISPQIELVGRDGNFEFSVPLALLGIKPVPGLRLKGDVGVLRGSALQTTARVYWSNKATAATADVPSEAMLAPSLWGTFEFQPEKAQ